MGIGSTTVHDLSLVATTFKQLDSVLAHRVSTGAVPSVRVAAAARVLLPSAARWSPIVGQRVRALPASLARGGGLPLVSRIGGILSLLVSTLDLLTDEWTTPLYLKREWLDGRWWESIGEQAILGQSWWQARVPP